MHWSLLGLLTYTTVAAATDSRYEVADIDQRYDMCARTAIGSRDLTFLSSSSKSPSEVIVRYFTEDHGVALSSQLSALSLLAASVCFPLIWSIHFP